MASAIELRHLRYFVAVAEESSFRRAAERLHITQPPLSRQVAELEELVGAKLLDRSASGVNLTRAGRAFFKRAVALLAQAGRLAEDLPVPAPSRLRIGITPGIGATRSARLETALRRELAPDDVAIAVEHSRDLLPALRVGRLDFAVIAHGSPVELEGLASRRLYSDPPAALMPSKHPAAKKRRVSLLELADLPFFWMERNYNRAYHDHCARIFRALGFRPRFRRVEPGSLLTLQRIGLGEGWTVSNAPMTLTRVPGVAYRELIEGNRICVHVTAAWNREGDARIARLAKVAAQTLG
jgi:DNA-binding transcriptional LysR family regulator